MQDCQFCDEQKCLTSCPLPFCSKTTVLDLLQKIGVEDNVSYYNEGKGKHDITLRMVWQKDFNETIWTHLSSVEKTKRVDIDESKGEVDMLEEQKEITIYDCFEEFSNSEMLDENNKWYCNKCKDHV